MSEILTMKQLVERAKSENLDELILGLSEEEMASLKAEILGWSEKELKPAQGVLNDYYDIKASRPMLAAVLANDLSLAYECETQGIRDTCQREILIDSISKALGIGMTWPTYADNERYHASFKHVFGEAFVKAGGKLGDSWNM